MLILHHAPKSRSSRFLWLLEELGAEYQVHYVDILRNDGTGGGDATNPHPLKQVPAITADGVTIVESVMIMLYLTDRYPGLAPAVGDPMREEYLGWLGLYNGVLEPVISAKFRGDLTAVQADAYAALDRRWREALDRAPYLLGDSFTAVDILFGSLLQFYRPAMPQYPIYDAYLARIGERPALAKAMTKDAKPDG
jgi:glutathione S-transferase